MSESSNNRPYLSLEEIADLLGVNYQLIYRLVRSGDLSAMKLGRVYRVKREDLEAFLERQRTGGAGGFTCGACGKFFESMRSKRADCPDTGQPICFDCWERKGVRRLGKESPQ